MLKKNETEPDGVATIEASAELRRRTQIVQIEHVSGRAAFGTLAQINDYTDANQV